MSKFHVIGKSVLRKEALAKVTGAARYTNDFSAPGMLHAQLVISPYAHARIVSVATARARQAPGVHAVVTGADCPTLVGEPLADRSPIAVERVRYHGEPVAVVVADAPHQAMRAAQLVQVTYAPLPVVHSPRAALRPDSPLVHEHLGSYERQEGIYPVPETNIANHVRIRKGNMAVGWATSEIVVEATVSFPQSDHVAMENRCAMAEISPDGRVEITSSTQAPYVVREYLSQFFGIDPAKVVVHTPLVGGGFGGKAPVQLEFIAYLASRAVGGRKVKLVNSREQDFITSPVHIGLDASVKLGATRQGRLVAAEIQFLFDGGAYSDRAAIITRAAAQDCTGPYRVDHVHCDAYCMYTNHPYPGPFRGYGHAEMTLAVERAMDMLADRLGLDPLELRRQNAIRPGDTTPTQAELTASTVGDLPQCIDRLKRLMQWDSGPRIEVEGYKVRAKGVSCFWKTSSTPTNAGAGAVLLFLPDGRVSLVCGAVEIGQGSKSVLAQIVAEKLKMDPDQVQVEMEVNTATCPEHWKTVASRTTLLVGRAALAAAEDALIQLKNVGATVLRCPTEDLEVGYGRVYVRANPQVGVDVAAVAHGYSYPDGRTVGGKVIGRGSYIMEHLTKLDPETGKGVPGPEWGVGAQAVEVEFDTRECTYRILRATTVVDAGVVLNYRAARGQITGGMNMGLSFAAGEGFVFAADGTIQNPQLRTYRVHRYGDHPVYLVDFVETPHLEAPYGLRGIGEHGVIGMPAALANSLTLAAGVPLNRLPLTPETIWRAQQEGKGDPFQF